MKQILRALIRFYQLSVSRYTQPHCIYIPTCSSYALEAIDRFGAIRGGLLSVWRLLRCNPFAKGGYDRCPTISLSAGNFRFIPEKIERNATADAADLF